MTKYRVYMTNTISMPVEVEADSPDDALEAAAEGDGLGTVMFLDHRYPDMGDWEGSLEDVEVIE